MEDDLINRQDAIDVVKHAWAKGLEPTQYLEELPSIQSEQKTGECENSHMTNADRIRAMSDEELAIWTANISICTGCPAKNINTASPCKGLYSGCKGNWFDWLKKEVEE